MDINDTKPRCAWVPEGDDKYRFGRRNKDPLRPSYKVGAIYSSHG